LTLTGSTGLIAGTPTTVGTSSFTVQVNDGATTAAKPLSIDIVNLRKLVGTTTSGTESVSKDYIQLSKFTASVTGTISQIRVYSIGTANVKVAIYADSAGEPGALIRANSSSNPVVADQWNTISITSTSVTSGTAYWLGVITDNNDALTKIVAPNPRRHKSEAYTGFTWPGTITGLTTADNMFPCIAGWGMETVPTPLAVTTVSLPSDTVNVAYAQILQAVGGSGSYTWSVTTGTLPDGLTLSAATGLISGTPTTAATSDFTVRVNDGLTTDDQPLSITINTEGTAQKLVGTNLPGTETITLGYIQLSKFTASTTGVISQISVYSAGTGNVKVAIYADSFGEPGALLNANSTSNPLVEDAWNNISITDTSVTAGNAYWLGAITDSNNAITKIVTPNPRRYKSQAYADFTWPGTLTDLSASDNMYLCIAGWSGGSMPLSISTDGLPGGTVGIPYSQTLEAIGGSGSYNWDIAGGSLPEGLSLDTSSESISGTPASTGNYNFVVQVNDGSATAAKPLGININPGGTTQKLVGTDTSSTTVVATNYIQLSKFTASATGTINQIRIYSAGSGNVKVAIYADNGGQPGSLIKANSNDNAVLPNQWNNIPIADTSITTGTPYWLGAIMSNGSVTRVTASNPRRYKIQTYTGFAWPASITGLSTKDDMYLCIAGWGIGP
jgi:hypothetical protein